MAEKKSQEVMYSGSGGSNSALAVTPLNQSPESATPEVLLAVVNEAPHKPPRESRYPHSAGRI